MTTNRPEDAARHDTSDALAGGEVGISRVHADQLAADPPDTGETPVPPRADARQKQAEAGEGGSAAAASAPEAPTPDRRAPSAGTPVAAQPAHGG